MSHETAVVIGAGPAGLTAAYELLQHTDVRPLVLEKSTYMGGISRTVNYRGNRIDIGGHRFFSKSDRIMQWWLKRLPLQATDGHAEIPFGQILPEAGEPPALAPDPETTDSVMLLRSRRSRIFFQRKFFDYPIALNLDTLRNLGLLRVGKIGLSYAHATLRPIRNAATLEQFFINRFGRELYETFFKAYTEKVWGIPCSQIGAEWGAQRIKGLSITKAVWHALRKPFQKLDVAQKGTETSLIEQFLYPKYGPGQMWEHVAGEVQEMGGEILTNLEVRRVDVAGNRIVGVEAVDVKTGEPRVFHGDYFFSTMPVQQLVRELTAAPPEPIRRIAEGLVYRGFITVGLLLTDLKVKERTEHGERLIRDNWIYIQEPDVRVGRLQIFNNWSPYLVADPSKVWIGMEYFCNEHDDLWVRSDEQLKALASDELARIGLIDPGAVLDGTVIRMAKTYPAYFGTYDRFGELRSWIDRFENLFLIGRNGMHRYNNQDHSMLTAMAAVECILQERTDKSHIWRLNTEQEYHEVRRERAAVPSTTADSRGRSKAAAAQLPQRPETPAEGEQELVLPSGEEVPPAET